MIDAVRKKRIENLCKQHSQRRSVADLFETFLEQLLAYGA
jgi:hypothetical protein